MLWASKGQFETTDMAPREPTLGRGGSFAYAMPSHNLAVVSSGVPSLLDPEA
jgi:hypothetical protein